MALMIKTMVIGRVCVLKIGISKQTALNQCYNARVLFNLRNCSKEPLYTISDIKTELINGFDHFYSHSKGIDDAIECADTWNYYSILYLRNI